MRFTDLHKHVFEASVGATGRPVIESSTSGDGWYTLSNGLVSLDGKKPLVMYHASRYGGKESQKGKIFYLGSLMNAEVYGKPDAYHFRFKNPRFIGGRDGEATALLRDKDGNRIHDATISFWPLSSLKDKKLIKTSPVDSNNRVWFEVMLADYEQAVPLK